MKLRNYLVENKVTQEEFAKELCITRSYFSQIVSGTRKPGKALAFRIEKMTDAKVTAKELLKGKAASKKKTRVVNSNYKKRMTVDLS